MARHRKLLALILVILLLGSPLGAFNVLAQPGAAPTGENESPVEGNGGEGEEGEGLPFDVPAESALLVEALTGKVLYAKDIDTPYHPASITKIMTLLLALEAIERGEMGWQDKVTVSEKAWEMGGSQMFLEIGQEVSVEDLLKGISIVSANDACVAIAEHLEGSESLFVHKMNERAKELGLTNSQFQNASGWPAEDHFMSARDIATLSAYIINTQPKILELESQREFTFNIGDPQYNRNPLLGRYPGADGLKTGWTSEAGYCLAGTAFQNNMRLVSVVLKTASDRNRLAATETLLDYGFNNYVYKVLVEKDTIVGEIIIPDGKVREVEVITADSLAAVVPVEDAGYLETSQEFYRVSAPLQKGDLAGEMLAYLDGELVSYVDLLLNEDVERAHTAIIYLRLIEDFLRDILSGLSQRMRQLFE